MSSHTIKTLKYDYILIVDKICLFSFLKVLQKSKETKLIHFLLPYKKNNIFIFVLTKMFKFKCKTISFHAGDLTMKNGRRCSFEARRVAIKSALNQAKKTIKNYPVPTLFEKNHEQECFQILLAQAYLPEIEKNIIKIFVAKSIFQKKKICLIIKMPIFKDLINSQSKIKIIYYYNLFNIMILKKLLFLFYLLKEKMLTQLCKLFLKILRRGFVKCQNNKPSISQTAEDDIHQNYKMRNTFFWRQSKKSAFNIIMPLNKTSLSYLKSSVQKLADSSVFLEPTEKKLLENNTENNHQLKIIQKEKRKTLLKLLFEKNYTLFEIYMLFYKLLSFCESSFCFVKNHNIKAHIFKEPWMVINQSFVFLQGILGIKTFMVQYSNMGFFSPSMTSQASIGCIFSKHYKKIFKSQNIGPKKFVVIGYAWTFAQKYLIKTAKKIRSDFKKNGVSKIIAYFDERICDSPLGFISKKTWQDTHQKLFEICLKNKKLGLIFKSQFSRFSPANMFKNNKIYKKLFKDKKIINLSSGAPKFGQRNNFRAMTAALVADLCICEKVGATTAIECMLVGKRTVVLDTHNVETFWEKLLGNKNIIFNSIESLFKYLKYPENLNLTKIGNWRTARPKIVGKTSCNLEKFVYKEIKKGI